MADDILYSEAELLAFIDVAMKDDPYVNKGNQLSLGYIVGRVMQASDGKADILTVVALTRKRLAESDGE